MEGMDTNGRMYARRLKEKKKKKNPVVTIDPSKGRFELHAAWGSYALADYGIDLEKDRPGVKVRSRIMPGDDVLPYGGTSFIYTYYDAGHSNEFFPDLVRVSAEIVGRWKQPFLDINGDALGLGDLVRFKDEDAWESGTRIVIGSGRHLSPEKRVWLTSTDGMEVREGLRMVRHSGFEVRGYTDTSSRVVIQSRWGEYDPDDYDFDIRDPRCFAYFKTY